MDAAEITARQRTNAVRQVLMNELGLTREMIREEVRAIVKETVERYFSDGNFRQWQDSVVELAVRRVDDYKLREQISSAVARRLTITINPPKEG